MQTPNENLKQISNKIIDARNNLDRKSTRLNSSHLVISYAVFCLKKKKKLYIDIKITLKQMLSDFIGIMVHSAKPRSIVHIAIIIKNQCDTAITYIIESLSCSSH